MKKQESKALGALVGIGSIIVIAGAIDYVNTVRVERAKRKKIKAWATMNLEAIAGSNTRMKKLVDDPSVTLSELLLAWQEETEFLNLINDQPMY